jgi:hypothetical protein
MPAKNSTQHPLQPTGLRIPFENSDSNLFTSHDMETAGSTYLCTSLEDYTRSMLAYTQSQISSCVGLDENTETSNDHCGDISANGRIQHQTPESPGTTEVEEAGHQAVNGAD